MAKATAPRSLEGMPSLEGAKAELARRRLIPFTQRMYPLYKPVVHHTIIAEALEAVERQEIHRLLITVPPRHGKSELASVHFPPWYLGRNPDKRIIAVSYSAQLAFLFSRRARNIVQSDAWPFPSRTAGDAAQVERWEMQSRRGGYVAAGVGGAITGMGADLLLIDDPVKSAAEAESETIRASTYDWFRATAYTRLEPGGAVIVIQTRWHELDLTGMLLSDEAEDWHHVNLPAVAEDNDAIGREPGEALWAERYSESDLARIKTQIGSRYFNALYQQRPSAQEGQIFKRDWWVYTDTAPEQVSWVIQVWDTAFKAKQENDYSVCLTGVLAYDGFHILDVWRDKVEFPDLERAVRSQYLKWRPNEVVVEDAASGQSLIQVLNHGMDTTNPWHNFGSLGSPIIVPIIPYKPDRDKVARAHAASPYPEARRIKIPVGAHWADSFVEELAGFPYGAHDDQVDVFTMFTMRAAQRALSNGSQPGLADWFYGMPE